MSRGIPAHPSDEARLAAEMARELEAMTSTTAVQPTTGFANRVMLAIADEPLPQPLRAFWLALLSGHLRAAAAAAGDAWRTISSSPAPLAVRAQAFALVLVLLVGSLAIAGGAAVGAFDLLGSGPTTPAPSGPPPSLLAPSPSPSPSPSTDEPSSSPEDSASPEPTETPEASETPNAHEAANPTARTRTASPTGTDDHGGGGSGSGSGSGSDGGDHTPSPTQTDGQSGGDG